MKMELLIHVSARFIHNHNSAPVFGSQYTARLYDKDIINDDFLGESRPDGEGNVAFTIDPKQYRSEDSMLETKPDFYIVLMDEGRQIFKTPVANNIDLHTMADFNLQEGEKLDLGTFMIGS